MMPTRGSGAYSYNYYYYGGSYGDDKPMKSLNPARPPKESVDDLNGL